MPKKKGETGVKELDWWHRQPTTVAGVAKKGGIGSTFSGMSLIGIARGTSQSLAESKEEHEKRVARQRGGAIVMKMDEKKHIYNRVTPETVVPGEATPLDIVGGATVGGAIESTLTTAQSKSHLRCPQNHTYKPGDKIFMKSGRPHCPKCEMHLELYIPFGE